MRFFRLAVVLVPLMLAACGSQPAGAGGLVRGSQQRGESRRLRQDGTRARPGCGRRQGPPSRGVGDDVILRYLREKRTVFYLTKVDIGVLRTAGVSSAVVDYMLQTPRMYTSYNGAIGNGLGYFPYYDPFWGPPYPNYPYPPHFAH